MQRPHVESAAWHLARAAMLVPEKSDFAAMAVDVASRLCHDDQNPIDVLRRLALRPEPPMAPLNSNLHRKLDATQAALHVLRERINDPTYADDKTALTRQHDEEIKHAV